MRTHEPTTRKPRAEGEAPTFGGDRVSIPYSRHQYIVIGLFFGMVAWFTEAAIHTIFFERQAFVTHLLKPDAHELWKRLLVASLLLIFSFYVQRGTNMRRRAQEALAISERRYRTLIQEALNPVFVVDDAGRFLEYNKAALEFFELEPDALAGKTFFDLLSPDSADDKPEDRTLHLGEIELGYRTNGDQKTILLNLVPLSSDSERPSFVGIGQDITGRKQAEHDLQMAHAELDQIFRTASAAMRLIDRNSRVLKVNQTFAELAGVSVEDAVGARCSDIFAGEKCQTPECPLVLILEGETEVEYKISKTRADGSKAYCLLTARPFLGPDGEPVGIVESFKDITELATVQEELRTERDRLHHILFQRFEGVGIIRPDYTLEYLNPTLIQEIGNRQGQPCFEAIHNRDLPCKPCFMREAIRTGKLQHCEMDLADGRTLEHTYTSFVDATGEAKAVMLLRDVTERRSAREAVIRADQLAALGELAAGVAHEINNPINGIINFGQMLVNRDRSTDEVRAIGERIVSEGDRVANIVESLLSFARRDSTAQVPTNIAKLLLDTLTLIGAQLRKDSITVHVDIDRDLPPVQCAAQEIQQVFLNLLSNARYALNNRFPAADEGKRLEITASSHLDGDEPLVRVTVCDHGVGIPSTILTQITNPFFSTKPKGQGTGLGLSISHQTIQNHGGRLQINSIENEYTSVSIELPIIPAEVDGEPVAVAREMRA